MATNTNEIIKNLYKKSAYKAFSVRKKNDSNYNINIFILLLFLFVILILSIKNNTMIDEKYWDIQKCYPKYIFYSGYIRRNPQENAYDSTVNNLYECANKAVEGKVDSTINEKMKNDLISLKNNLVEYRNKDVKEIDELSRQIKNQRVNIDAQFEAMKKDLTLDATSIKRNSLYKNLGIYMDQFNSYIDSTQKYIKQFLTYRMLESANKCYTNGNGSCNDDDDNNYKKAMKYKNLLEMHFGGTDL